MIECPGSRYKGQQRKGQSEQSRENSLPPAPVQVSQEKERKAPSTPWMGSLVPAIHASMILLNGTQPAGS